SGRFPPPTPDAGPSKKSPGPVGAAGAVCSNGRRRTSTRWHRSNRTMDCNLVVAVGRATVDGQALFGQNSNRPAGQAVVQRRAPGEMVHPPHVELPQARQTYTVLGAQPAGWWGYQHGVNEHGLAAGCTGLRTKLRGKDPKLSGGDLVRLTLERCRNAGQAVDL